MNQHLFANSLGNQPQRKTLPATQQLYGSAQVLGQMPMRPPMTMRQPMTMSAAKESYPSNSYPTNSYPTNSYATNSYQVRPVYRRQVIQGNQVQYVEHHPAPAPIQRQALSYIPAPIPIQPWPVRQQLSYIPLPQSEPQQKQTTIQQTQFPLFSRAPNGHRPVLQTHSYIPPPTRSLIDDPPPPKQEESSDLNWCGISISEDGRIEIHGTEEALSELRTHQKFKALPIQFIDINAPPPVLIFLRSLLLKKILYPN